MITSKGQGMTSDRTRSRMVEKLREEGIKNESVLSALESIPRHMFVDEALNTRSYEMVSLPIGYGQTISHPFIVARLEHVLSKNTLYRVLRLGVVVDIKLLFYLSWRIKFFQSSETQIYK